MDSNTRGATWCPSSCVSTCVCAWRICATRAHVLRVVVERMNGQRHQFQVLDSDAACVGVCRSTDRQNDGSTRRGRRHRQLPRADSGSGGTLCRPCGKARGALLGSLGTLRQVTSKIRLDSWCFVLESDSTIVAHFRTSENRILGTSSEVASKLGFVHRCGVSQGFR